MEETSTPNKKRLISELIKGRESTKMLQNLLQKKVYDDGSVSVEDLVKKIMESFSDSLVALNSWDSGEFCHVPASTYAGSACSDDRTLDSGESEKKPVSVVKDRRGCYKRRKTEDSRIKIVDTIEDGYAWRKYGQKEILNAKSPRCYFRCTHKHEGCKALKQVQKLEDGSEMFHITYFGFHTCQDKNKNTQMFLDSGALNCFLLNFEDSKIKSSPSSLSTITNVNITPSLEQEYDSNAESDDHLPSSNHGLWKDIIGNLEPSHDDIFKNSMSIYDFRFDESVFL